MAISRPVVYVVMAMLAVQCIANLPAANAGGGGGGGGGGRCCGRRPRPGCRRCSSAEAQATGDYLKVAALNVAKVYNADGPFTAQSIQECLSRAVVTLSKVSITTKAPADAASDAVTKSRALAHELNRISSTEAGLTVYVTKDVQVAEGATAQDAVVSQLHSDVAQAAAGLINVQGCAAHSNAEFKFAATLDKIVNFNMPADACSELEGAQIKGSFKEADVAAQADASWKVFVASSNTCA